MKKTYLQATLAIMLSISSLVSNAQFSLSGEIRPRVEFRNGFKTLNTADNSATAFVEQRTRLNFGFKRDRISTKISLQDIRMWGNTAQIYKTDPSLTNVFEAYGSYQISDRTSITVGRQALSYDNERFFGILDWAQQSRSHDLAKFSYKDSLGFTLDFGAGFNQNLDAEPSKLSSTFYSGTANYKTMQYLWLHKDFNNAKFSLLAVNDGRQKADSTTAFKQTIGLYGEQKFGPVNLHEEAFYQTGRSTASANVSAFLLAFSASFPKIFSSPEIGIDYLSGSEAGSTKEKAFDPSFGTNHKFYGFMDYFYVGNPHGQNGKTTGLIDIYLNTKIKTGKRSALILNIHQFNSPADMWSGTEQLSNSLGQEIDLVFNLNIMPDLNFKAGYSQLFSTASMEAIKSSTNKGANQWAWTMLTFTPKFL